MSFQIGISSRGYLQDISLSLTVLVRTLRESGCSDDSIATWTNQRLVQALISKDLSRNLAKAADDEDSEDERSNDEGGG